MSSNIELIVHSGSGAESDHYGRTPLPALSPAGISAACRASTAPFVGVGSLSGSIDAAALRQALDQLSAGGAEIAVLPLHGNDWMEMLVDLPPAVLARLPQVIQSTLIVVRRDLLLSSIARLEPGEPVDRVLTHLADAGCRFHLRSGTLPAATPLAAFAHPPLVPAEPASPIPELERFLAFDPHRVAQVRSREDVTALCAGLFQVHDALERSHSLAQTIEGRGERRAGDYWHAIMHRREPDYGNAKYWFRRVGAHPIHAELASRASRLFAPSDPADVIRWRTRLGLPGAWDALAFVDLCERAAAGESGPLGQVARRIQWTEMLLLLKATSHDAFGEAAGESTRAPPDGPRWA